MSPYAIADSLGPYHWFPSDGPHAKALGKWRNGQKSPNGFTGDQDVSIGHFALYRMRIALAGDLTGAWADFGGLVAHLDLIAPVTDMPTAYHQG